MNNLYIGIDFSYNSCGVTFKYGKAVNHVCIYNKDQIKKNGIELTDEEAYEKLEVLRLVDNPQCMIMLHHRDKVPQVKDIGLLAWERIHMAQTILHSRLAYNTITTWILTNYRHVDPKNIFIAFENYSYTKNTGNSIQIIEHTSPVKQMLIGEFLELKNLENFFIATAPTIKKFAGSGSYDKYDMFQAFLKENLDNNFQKALLKNEKKFYIPRIKRGKPFNEMIAPVSDIIDSYFICKWVEKQIEEIN